MPQTTRSNPPRPAVLWTLIWIVLLGPGSLPAQEFLYRHYQNNNELPNQFISSVMQDEDGRIWLSTRRGIVIYNGAEWNKLTLEGRALTAEDFIKGADGSVWLLDRPRLAGLELMRWRKQTIRKWTLPETILQRPDETWMDGLIRIDGRNGETLVLTTSPPALVSFQESRGWRRHPFASPPADMKITGMTPYYDSILISTSSGLYRFDGDTLFAASEFNSDLPDRDLLGVAWESSDPLRGSTLWIIGRKWIQRIDSRGRETYPVAFPRKEWDHSAVVADRTGTLFMLMKYRARLYPPDLFFFSSREGTLENIGHHDGLEGMSIQCIAQDREKIIWMGTSRGVCKLVNPSFRTFRKEHGLLDDEVSAIHFYRDEVILGHNIGYTRYRAGRFSSRLFPPGRALMQRVSNIDSDSRGRIYMACGQLGLLVIDADGSERFFSPTDPMKQWVSGVCVDSVHDRIWTSAGNRIYSFTGDSFQPVNTVELPETVNIRNIQLLPGGLVIFLTSEEGAITFDGARWRRYKSETDPQSNSVYYALLHPENGLLLATSSGLCRLEGENLNRFSLGDTELLDLCFSLNLDQQGNLWIGTVNGVISWNGASVKRHRSSDGVPGHEINRNALKIAPDGRLWIGSNGGVSVYQPLFDQSDSLPPPRVILSELLINQLRRPADQAISLQYSQNSFSIHFCCPSYINEFENRFRHRLKGYEEEWREVSGKQLSHVYYQNLPPGRYYFEIMAANAYGEWGPICRSGTVTILRPFWKSLWFLLILSFFILLIPLWAVFTYIQKRHARRLEEEVRSRTEELCHQKAELERLNNELRLANTTKNKFFSIIAHDLRNPFTSLLTGTEFLVENFDTLSNEMKKKNSREIQQAAKLTYDLVNNLLDWSRTQINRIEFVPSRIDLTRLIRQILSLVESDTGRKSLQLNLLMPPRCDMLGDRHMIRFILRNLISNAVKFTPRGGHITITVYDHSDRWSVGIQDTGIGIPPEKLEILRRQDTPFSSNGTEGERGTGLGLILCREFIQIHKGSLTITSQAGQGSLFTVSLPKGDLQPPQHPENR